MPDEGKQEKRHMDRLMALGILLLGAGIGALVSSVKYIGQVRKFKRLLQARLESNPRPETENRNAEDRRSKSA